MHVVIGDTNNFNWWNLKSNHIRNISTIFSNTLINIKMFLQARLINNEVFLLQVREVDSQIIEEKSSITFETLVANFLM